MVPTDKWQRMLALVQQQSELVQPNLPYKFKKLIFQRLLTENIFIFLLQYSGLNLNHFSLGSSPMWFASGTACAYLFLRGYSVLPGIWFGSFFAYSLAKASFCLSFSCATVLSLQAVGLLWFNYYCLRSPSLIFYRLPLYFKFILFTTVLTALTSALFILIYWLLLPDHNITFNVWLQGWLGNLNAILIFSCALVTWDSFFSNTFSIKQIKKKQLFLYALLVLVTVSLALSSSLIALISLALLSLLITVLISVKFGWSGSITASFLSGLLLSFAAFLDASLFKTPFVLLALPFLQLLLCMETVIGLSLAIASPEDS